MDDRNEIDQDYEPTDLVKVQDVYGRTFRVRKARLEQGCHRLLVIYTPQGRKYADRDERPELRWLDRGNIAPEGKLL